MFKYVMANSKFVNGKMLSVTNAANGFVKLNSLLVDLSTGD